MRDGVLQPLTDFSVSSAASNGENTDRDTNVYDATPMLY